MNIISRSALIMFTFDLAALAAVSYTSAYLSGFETSFQALSAFLISICGVVCLYLKGYYKIREFNPTSWNAYRLFEGIFLAHILPAAVLSRCVEGIQLTEFLLVNMFLLYTALMLYRLLFHYYLFNIKKIQNVLIIGADERAKIIADEIQAKYALKMQVSAFVNLSGSSDFIQDEKIPVYSNLETLENIIKENNIDIVVIAEPSELILTVPRSIKMYKMPDFYEMVTGKFYIDEKTITELYYQLAVKNSFIYDFNKRNYDIIAALIILIVTLPVMIYLAVKIKLADGGSILYTQNRITKGGKVFKAYKLRTMYKNDYTPEEGKIKADTAGINDNRVIKGFGWVRKARLDEIPQMINILKGDISITGPRTEWEDLVKIYKKEIPYYSFREQVKTGWTGWAQINQGHCVMKDDISEKLAYDLYYIKHRNFLWEIGILVKAVCMALGGRHE